LNEIQFISSTQQINKGLEIIECFIVTFDFLLALAVLSLSCWECILPLGLSTAVSTGGRSRVQDQEGSYYTLYFVDIFCLCLKQ